MLRAAERGEYRLIPSVCSSNPGIVDDEADLPTEPNYNHYQMERRRAVGKVDLFGSGAVRVESWYRWNGWMSCRTHDGIRESGTARKSVVTFVGFSDFGEYGSDSICVK